MSRESEATGGSERSDSRAATDGSRERADPATEERREGVAVERRPLVLLVVLLGGLVFGFGLALSEMAKPEVVLDFLQFEDFGLLFVMGGAAVVSGLSFLVATRYLDRAPVTGTAYARRLKTFDRNVVVGGVVFGLGWGISGICPGAAYASLGIGNVAILWGVAGMFLGAYAQGYWRSRR